MITFFLNYHPAILVGLLLLTAVYKFYATCFRTNKTTDQDDYLILAKFSFVGGSRSGRMIPMSAYEEWSKNTIKD